MGISLLIAGSVLVVFPVAYLMHVWWMERHLRYPVWPADGDGPQTEFRDQDDFLGIGS